MPAKKSTRVTVAGATAIAVAARATGTPIVTVAPAPGAVRATLGAVTETLTFTTVEVTTVPSVSVTLAVNALIPVALGVQLKVYSEPEVGVRAVPMIVVPARKSTRLTAAPPLAVADALIVVGEPSAMDAPFVGAVIAIAVRELATVTLAVFEVVVTPPLTVTLAEMRKEPVEVGVQLTV